MYFLTGHSLKSCVGSGSVLVGLRTSVREQLSFSLLVLVLLVLVLVLSEHSQFGFLSCGP